MEYNLYTHLFIYLLLGCAASFISGLLGVGGGLILVPGLVFIFTLINLAPSDQLMQLSIGTSLAGSIINLLIAVRTHQRNHTIIWPLFITMTPSLLLGALLLGPALMIVIRVDYLKILFGLFCSFVSIHMLVGKENPNKHKAYPNKKMLSVLGISIGSLSTVLGIAGGVMISTALHHYGIDARKVIGTTSAICIVIAIAGTIGLLFVGYHQPNLPAYTTGYIYWPALLGIAVTSPFITPLGAKLVYKLPTSILKKIFSCLILVIGLKMLSSGLGY